MKCETKKSVNMKCKIMKCGNMKRMELQNVGLKCEIMKGGFMKCGTYVIQDYEM